MRRFIEKNFKNDNICVCIPGIPRTFDHVENQEDERKMITEFFPNCEFMDKNEFSTLLSSSNNDNSIELHEVQPLRFLMNMNETEFYHFDGSFMRLKPAHRPRKSEFCE